MPSHSKPPPQPLAYYAVQGSLKRLHYQLCHARTEMGHALVQGWMRPEHHADSVRRHPLTIADEMVRLLSAVRYWYSTFV